MYIEELSGQRFIFHTCFNKCVFNLYSLKFVLCFVCCYIDKSVDVLWNRKCEVVFDLCEENTVIYSSYINVLDKDNPPSIELVEH